MSYMHHVHLQAARLGDLKMLTELWTEGYSLLSTDETGKTGKCQL
jgi:hypothetical protein